ncbi:hypothetical protein PF002_g6868 [Phytophthora fragariae]|uniref:Tc1-like transposase DDE domain-containing protein n=1 Tax=Phytophthora fragariae TaxID=53985 RepID=A0A6A4A250_9STRA|nr:hypothetical protein PF002_g6868 [Phytophthora fragariae]
MRRSYSGLTAKDSSSSRILHTARTSTRALVDYVEENCLLTLEQLKTTLVGKLYTLKQVRIEPATCNGEVNIKKRKQFAEDLLKYSREGAFIVYYDETNYNLHCKHTQGRALKGKRAIVKLSPSKGKSLQIQ